MPINKMHNGVYFTELLKAALLQKEHGIDFSRNTEQDSASSVLHFFQNFFSLLESASPDFPKNRDDETENFLINVAEQIHKELASINTEDLTHALRCIQESSNNRELYSAIWKVFSPEALDFAKKNFDKEIFVKEICEKRKIRLTEQNSNPIQYPADEILFTSNALFTIPEKEAIAKLPVSQEHKTALHDVIEETQLYWYDHPMPLGIDIKANELIYGMKKLAEALKIEKKKGTAAPDTRLTVVLSVSLTHEGLESVIPEYLRNSIQEHVNSEDLDIYIFTEEKTQKILAALPNVPTIDKAQIAKVFGVNGRYGRHYNFLKAIAALWKICKDNRKRATFKIDLDQVFPQEELIAETQKTALQHFVNPNWGGRGLDNEGNEVYLGMIAGALVNEADIDRGLFTPDVPYPNEPLTGEDLFFPRTLLMALSTRAEMMTRYKKNSQDRIHRIHVTGGTNGILVEALRKYRPFTPTCIGRAEDQAYLLSVYNSTPPYLRYLHASGLIMRHDKATFASEAIKKSKAGTFAGDLLRIVLFSRYAKLLPGGIDSIYKNCAPFTSAYISKSPICLMMIRLFFQTMDTLKNKGEAEAQHLLNEAVRVINSDLQKNETIFAEEIQYEKEAWDMYYNALDELEKVEHGYLRKKIHAILESSQLTGKQPTTKPHKMKNLEPKK